MTKVPPRVLAVDGRFAAWPLGTTSAGVGAFGPADAAVQRTTMKMSV
jgi:hypothetical protein